MEYHGHAPASTFPKTKAYIARTVRKHKVKPVQRPRAFVLVYSFGDEIYRKVRLSSLLRPCTEEPSELFVQTPDLVALRRGKGAIQ